MADHKVAGESLKIYHPLNIWIELRDAKSRGYRAKATNRLNRLNRCCPCCASCTLSVLSILSSPSILLVSLFPLSQDTSDTEVQAREMIWRLIRILSTWWSTQIHLHDHYTTGGCCISYIYIKEYVDMSSWVLLSSITLILKNWSILQSSHSNIFSKWPTDALSATGGSKPSVELIPVPVLLRRMRSLQPSSTFDDTKAPWFILQTLARHSSCESCL